MIMICGYFVFVKDYPAEASFCECFETQCVERLYPLKLATSNCWSAIVYLHSQQYLLDSDSAHEVFVYFLLLDEAIR